MFFHRPPYSSGTEHGSDLAIRQAFGTLSSGTGSSSSMGTSTASSDRCRGASTNTARQAVTYIVTGGGGAESYPIGRSPWTAFARAVPHYVRMTISPTNATLEAVGANDAVLDRYTLSPSQQKSDTAAPQVSIVSPGSGATLSGNANVSVSADDDVRVEKVDLWLDGQLRAIDLTEPYSFTIDTTTLTDGTHSIEARAYDIDGKRASAARSVRVSNGPQAADIVLYAAEAPVRAGSWRVVADSTAAGGRRLEHPEAGGAIIDPLANPQHYVELGVTVNGIGITACGCASRARATRVTATPCGCKRPTRSTRTGIRYSASARRGRPA